MRISKRQLRELNRKGRIIVFTNGCFDLLHPGHVVFLQIAKAQGDILVVGINDDAGVTRLKGPGRPVVDEDDRVRMVDALRCVDYTFTFDDPDPCGILDSFRPDILVKGGTTPEIIGREIVESYGGKVMQLGICADTSTTRMIEKIRKF